MLFLLIIYFKIWHKHSWIMIRQYTFWEYGMPSFLICLARQAMIWTILFLQLRIFKNTSVVLYALYWERHFQQKWWLLSFTFRLFLIVTFFIFTIWQCLLWLVWEVQGYIWRLNQREAVLFKICFVCGRIYLVLVS